MSTFWLHLRKATARYSAYTKIQGSDFMRLCELSEKDVINICTCKKIGYVIDIEFEKKSCHATALIVSQGIRFFNLFCNDELVIPWCNIKQIGPDVILVEIPG
jgi:YlmC/YmxH family sporulation protein